MDRNKEEIYDEEISPLMKQIIAACVKHKIGMFMTFNIPTEEIEDLKCTTSIPAGPDDTAGDELIEKLVQLARPKNARIKGQEAPHAQITIQNGDGTQSLIAVI